VVHLFDPGWPGFEAVGGRPARRRPAAGAAGRLNREINHHGATMKVKINLPQEL
jgi:hypothetical protein